NATVDTSGGGVAGTGTLKLTTATANQSGSFIIDDLDPGLRVNSFTATFKLRMGGGDSTPADGISFNFASDLPSGAFSNGTEGEGHGLTIVFDTYDNTLDLGEGPEFRVKYAGAIVARSKAVANHFRTDVNFVDIQ